MTMDVNKLDIFMLYKGNTYLPTTPTLHSVPYHTGIQFLPLDKNMFLKVHYLVNQLESTFRLVHSEVAIKSTVPFNNAVFCRQICRSVFLYGDQLVW